MGCQSQMASNRKTDERNRGTPRKEDWRIICKRMYNKNIWSVWRDQTYQKKRAFNTCRFAEEPNVNSRIEKVYSLEYNVTVELSNVIRHRWRWNTWTGRDMKKSCPQSRDQTQIFFTQVLLDLQGQMASPWCGSRHFSHEHLRHKHPRHSIPTADVCGARQFDVHPADSVCLRWLSLSFVHWRSSCSHFPFYIMYKP